MISRSDSASQHQTKRLSRTTCSLSRPHFIIPSFLLYTTASIYDVFEQTRNIVRGIERIALLLQRDSTKLPAFLPSQGYLIALAIAYSHYVVEQGIYSKEPTFGLGSK